MYKSKKTNKAEKKLRRIGTRRILAMAAAALMAAGVVPQGTGFVQAKGTVLEETDTANNSSETFWSRLTAKAASFFGIGDDSKERSVDDHTVEGISPQGTTINLFDYWVNQRDSPDYNNNNDNGGINAGHQLKFTTGSSGSMNSWTGSAAPREGIVSNKLVNGYPQLSGSSELGMTRTESRD